MSLETSLYWLSEDIVRVKIEVGVEEKCTKILTPFQHVHDNIIVYLADIIMHCTL